MKIQKQKKNRKKLLIIIAAIVLVLAAGGIAWALGNKPAGDKGSQQQTSSEEQNNDSGEQTPTNPETSDPKEQPTDPIGEDKTTDEVPVNPTASITITELGQQANEITVNSMLAHIKTQGTCVATFTQSGAKPVVKQFNSSGVTRCGPLRVSALEFTSLGTWKLNLRFYNQGQQVIVEKNVTIH